MSLYADRIPLDRVSIPQTEEDRSAEFWSTPPQAQESDSREVLEIRLRSPQPINYLTADIPRFPHSAVWEVRKTGQWVEVGRRKVLSSEPSYIDYADPEVHPEHFGSGHWEKFSVTFEGLTTDRVRLVLQRGPGVPPVGFKGAPIPYPLGARRVDVGYRIKSLATTPESARSDVPDVIGQSRDINGNPIRFLLGIDQSSGPVNGNPWRCEPQPVADAVVNFYVDGRTDAGAAQVVDRIYLDPITPGVPFNLYWTNDEPSASFWGGNDPIGSATATDITVTTAGAPLLDAAPTGRIEVPLAASQMKFDSDWWVAAKFAAETASVDADERCVFDAGSVRLSISSSRISLLGDSGEVVGADFEFPAGANVIVAGGIVGGHAVVRARAGAITAYATVSSPAIAVDTASLTIGNDAAFGSVLKGTLTDFLAKQSALSADEWADYLSAPNYSSRRQVLTNSTTTDDSPFRFHRSLVVADTGVVGGMPDRFSDSDIVWNHLPSQFILHKGAVRIPPTFAKFWKFEFTSLAPVLIESFLPSQVRVLRFPRELVESFPSASASFPGAPRNPAFRTSLLFDSFETTRQVEDRSDSPTSMIVIPADDNRSVLESKSFLYGGREWKPSPLIPHHDPSTTHEYDESVLLHDDKLGFIVGLNEVRLQRQQAELREDNTTYVEAFLDDRYIDQADWTYDAEGYWYTTSPNALSIESITLESERPVTAIQFATRQTDATQIVPDDDFADPILALNNWETPGRWRRIGSAVLFYQQTQRAVTVNRQIFDPSGEAPESGTVIREPVDPVLSGKDYYSTVDPDANLGGLSSPLIQSTGQGSLNAIARVRAETELTAPLYLQLFDSEDNLLSESAFTPEPGEVLDVQTSYTYDLPTGAPAIGSLTVTEPEVIPPEEPGVTPSPEEIAAGLIYVRVVQKGSTEDVFTVLTCSVFDDALRWEFCVDEDTEIFTKRGWLSWDEVQIGDQTLGVNPATGLSEWQHIHDLFVDVPRSREMVQVESQQLSALTTGNHRWLSWRRQPDPTPDGEVRCPECGATSTRRGPFRAGRSLSTHRAKAHGVTSSGTSRSRQWSWRTTDELTGDDSIPTGAICADLPSEPKYTDAFVELVAWMYTEGWIESSGQVRIGQSHEVYPVNVSRIRAALTRMCDGPVAKNGDGLTWSEGVRADGMTIFNISNEASRHLTDVAPDKAPALEFLLSLTQSQIELFVDVCMMGDGDNFGNFAQRLGAMMEVFTTACVLAGRAVYREVVSSAHPHLGQVHHSQSSTFASLGRASKREVIYEGRVWCPTTQHGNWLARRAGTVYFTGNSNNGGATWTPAVGIRNNSRGVLTFPSPGTELRWRVTGYRNKLALSALKIRPWYGDVRNKAPSRPMRGPNLSPFDFDPDIFADEMFNYWTSPIPRSWYERFALSNALPVGYVRARIGGYDANGEYAATTQNTFDREGGYIGNGIYRGEWSVPGEGSPMIQTPPESPSE